MTETEALEEWKKECREWQEIKDELITNAGPEGVSAFDVSDEQRRRATARGQIVPSDNPLVRAVLGLDPPSRLARYVSTCVPPRCSSSRYTSLSASR